MRTEKLDLCKICGKMFLKTKDLTVCPTCAPQKYLPRFTAQPESSPILPTKNGKPIKENVNVQKDGKWSLKYECCVKCGGNDVKHVARGLCLNCYRQESEKRNRGKQRLKKGLASNKLDYKYLYEEYMNEKRSLGDIAKDCNCSRQYVLKKMKEFRIPLRTPSEARTLALNRQKVAFKILGQDGNERLVIPGGIKINEDFFTHWANETAYVLGVIYTEGHINPGRKLDPSQKTTTMSPLEDEDKEAYALGRREKIAPLILKRRIWWESVPEASSYRVYVSKDRTAFEPASFSWERTPSIISKLVIGKTELVIPDEWPEFPSESGTYYIGITSIDDVGNQSEPLLLSGLFKFFAPSVPLRGGIEYV